MVSAVPGISTVGAGVGGNCVMSEGGGAIGAGAVCTSGAGYTGEGTGAFEIHTLSLPGGTIVGVGVGGGRERNYAIVGGTGKYTGARGSYLARQDTYGLGGDGKAEILLTLLD